MVQVTFLEGPHAGQVLSVTPGATPQDILCGWSQYRYRWETDYAEASEEERATWLTQEVSLRCVRALAQGLPVRGEARTYRARTIGEALSIMADIESALYDQGKRLAIRSDDEHGITFETF